MISVALIAILLASSATVMVSPITTSTFTACTGLVKACCNAAPFLPFLPLPNLPSFWFLRLDSRSFLVPFASSRSFFALATLFLPRPRFSLRRSSSSSASKA